MMRTSLETMRTSLAKMRTILALLACSVLSCAQPSSSNVMGSYKFTAPQTPQGMEELATMVRNAASVPQVSVETSTATLTFSGPPDAVNFAEWILPQVDKTAGDSGLHEYKLPSGDIGRIGFLSNVPTAQNVQELMTIVRTVADVRWIQILASNRAIVLRGPEWQIAFAAWIIGQLDQPLQQRSDPTSRAFTVGGPDYRTLGHGARLMYLASMTSPQQTQQVLSVLRSVADVQKVFSYTATHALVFRAGDVDLKRAEWLIQQLDATAGHPPGTTTFTDPAADDVTREFYLGNTDAHWIQSAVTSLRTELKVKKIFFTTAPANIVVRGTTNEIAAVAAWMTSHNALLE
jgi:hypothetical protein